MAGVAAALASPLQPQQSAIKAPTLVALGNFQHVLDTVRFRRRIISMPLQVGTLPVNSPVVATLHISGFDYRVLKDLVRTLPHRPDFKDFNALSCDTKRDIKFFAKMGRWPSRLNIRINDFLAAFLFELAECHVQAPTDQ